MLKFFLLIQSIERINTCIGEGTERWKRACNVMRDRAKRHIDV